MKNEKKAEEIVETIPDLYSQTPELVDDIAQALDQNTRETVERCQEAVRQEFKKKQNNEGSPKAKLHGEEIKAFLGIVWNDTHQALEKLKEEL